MNKNTCTPLECETLLLIRKEGYRNQREIAETLQISLGKINSLIRDLIEKQYLNDEKELTQKAWALFENGKTKNAIILAAGYGMRMGPLSMEMPKGLVEVGGQRLIDRLICQLREQGIEDIHVIVGFMKEKYEYLIDKYQVRLIVNPDYRTKNNLFSLVKDIASLNNTYIVPCDLWFRVNPFGREELHSWYLMGNSSEDESSVCVSVKKEIRKKPKSIKGNPMIGLAYLTGNECEQLKRNLQEMCDCASYYTAFWEEALFDGDKMILPAKLISPDDVIEINTFEQLRELDQNSDQLRTDALDIVTSIFHTSITNIKNVIVVKKGMTNRSFLFEFSNKKYIMRVPGEGTNHLIDREKEASVYHCISQSGIGDDVIYINPQNGYKIAAYYENSRVCDSQNLSDLQRCIDYLREFHEQELVVDHEFDLFERIAFYESLWNGQESAYEDYLLTKKHVFQLKGFVESFDAKKVLTHIDAVPDNFLFIKNGEQEDLRLIDWEYSAMQDPHVDIAMFCIYSLYDRAMVDYIIDLYFNKGCTDRNRYKIYAYIAICGLLWSNWCEYKRFLGVEFGEYSLRQYRYAKDYYDIVSKAYGDGLKGEKNE